MKKLILFCLIFGSACTFKQQDHALDNSYFDLAGYFKAEAARLTQANLAINKTVVVNNKAETKQLKISNWEKEFDPYISADINKASWKGAFKLEKKNDTATYTSDSEKIPVKKVALTYQDDKIKAIRIWVTNTNDLYTSTETLSYYPDSLYQINMVQQIKLMDEKKYQVIGKFR